MHDPAEEADICPAPHAEQVTDDALANFPAVHAMQFPVAAEKPGKQTVHADEPATDTEPEAQTVQETDEAREK